MTNTAAFDQPARYQIRVKGALDQEWSAWFDGLEIVALGDGETLLTGRLEDQAALHGLLQKVYNLGLPLISVQRESEEEL
jgi:hypothetical protein